MIVKMILPKIKRLLDTSVFDFVFRKPDRIILFYNKTNIVMQIKLDNLNVQIFFNSIDLFFQPEEKKKLLRKFSFFHLKVQVLSGKDLLAMDRGGKVHKRPL